MKGEAVLEGTNELATLYFRYCEVKHKGISNNIKILMIHYTQLSILSR